jgi:three-Cys-motif partner protein
MPDDNGYTGYGSSEYTQIKQDHLRHIMAINEAVVYGIIARGRAYNRYVYVDLTAGPGIDKDGIHGSPMVFLETIGIRPHRAYMVEREPATFRNLNHAVMGYDHSCIVRQADASTVASEIIADISRQAGRSWVYGIVYADPTETAIEADVLRKFAVALPQVDILINMAATHLKRERNSPNGKRQYSLKEYLAAIGKKYALVREPYTKHQWSFFLLTNWDQYPEVKKMGFVRADSEAGKVYLERMHFTAAELQAQQQPGLPYASYAEYLRHPKFRAVRSVVIARSGGTCERCKARRVTEVHHLIYPKWGTFDVPENMIAICHQCHCEIHGKEN